MFGSTFSLFAILLFVGITPAPLVDNGISASSINDGAVWKGMFTIQHLDPDGNIISEQFVNNLVPHEGLECTADLVFGTTSCVGELDFQWLALGTGTNAPADGDTTLQTEVGGCTRLEDTTPDVITAIAGQRSVAVISLFSGASCEGSAFAETGLFDAVTTGNMLARSAISPAITLNSGDTLNVNYTIIIANT